MSFHLLYESCGWHTRCALFDEQGRLLTLRFDDISRRYIEGALVWGRVRSVVPSLGAAFMDIGDVHDGLLQLSTLPAGQKLHEGQGVLCRITRGGFGEKGAKLDARVVHKMPQEPTSVGLVMPAPSALKRALRDAGSTPVKVWLPHGLYRDVVAKAVPERQIVHLDDRADAPDWLGKVDDALSVMVAEVPTFAFSNGDIKVELTSAVATMDINFRPLVGVSKGDTVLAANLAAADEVARLVRLLDLGGAVVVDFITPKNKAQRTLIDDHLHAALSTTDDHFEHLRAMSPHGLSEITRARTGPSLMLLLKTPPFVAGATALNLWRMPAGANPALRQQTLRAHPSVAELLKTQLTEALCLRVLGRPVQVLAEANRGVAEVAIEG